MVVVLVVVVVVVLAVLVVVVHSLKAQICHSTMKTLLINIKSKNLNIFFKKKYGKKLWQEKLSPYHFSLTVKLQLSPDLITFITLK